MTLDILQRTAPDYYLGYEIYKHPRCFYVRDRAGDYTIDAKRLYQFSKLEDAMKWIEQQARGNL